MGLISKAGWIGVGYVLGARAGTARYDQIAAAARKLAARPELQAYLRPLTDRLAGSKPAPPTSPGPATAGTAPASPTPAGPPPLEVTVPSGPEPGLAAVPSPAAIPGGTPAPAASPGRGRLNKRPPATR